MLRFKKRLPTNFVCLLMISFLVLVAFPKNGFSTLIEQTETFMNESFGTELAQVAVAVYAPGETYAGETLDEYLYHYNITNTNGIDFYPVTLLDFSLFLNKAAPVSSMGADSPDVLVHYNTIDNHIKFSGLYLQEPESTSVYIWSPAAPELVSARVVSDLGLSPDDSPMLWAPDPVVPDNQNQIPEPNLLLLIGTGLVGLAGYRRILAK